MEKPPVKAILLLLGLMVLFYFAGFYMIAAILDILHKEGLIPGTEADWRVYAGLLRTIPQAVGLALSFLWGVLADKMGRRKVLFVLGILMAVGLLGVSLSINYIQLMISFTVFGIAMIGISPVIYAFIADVVPTEKRGAGYAVYYAASVFGMAVGLVMAGIFLEWRLAYLLTAVLVFLFATPLFIVSRGVTIGYVEKKEVGEYGLKKALSATLKPTALLILIHIIPWTMPWGMLSLFAVDYIQTRWGVSKGSATLIVSLAVLSIAIGHIVGGMISDKLVKKGDPLARPKVSIAGITIGYLTMIAMLAYPYPYGVETMATLLPPALLAISGMMFTTFAYPNISSVLSDVIEPEYRGTVFSIYNVLNTAGWAIGPFVYPVIVKYLVDLGTPTNNALMNAAIAIVSLWLVCIVFWIIIAKTYPRDKIS